MFAAFSQINWLAVAVSSVAVAALGGVWFAVLFPKAYWLALGREGDPKPTPGVLFIAGPFVCATVTAATSAFFMEALEIATYGEALLFGTIVGVGYLVATMTTTAINPNMPRPFAYSLISGPYFLISSLLISAVVVALE